jgi:hypothetical protein
MAFLGFDHIFDGTEQHWREANSAMFFFPLIWSVCVFSYVGKLWPYLGATHVVVLQAQPIIVEPHRRIRLEMPCAALES